MGTSLDKTSDDYKKMNIFSDLTWLSSESTIDCCVMDRKLIYKLYGHQEKPKELDAYGNKCYFANKDKFYAISGYRNIKNIFYYNETTDDWFDILEKLCRCHDNIVVYVHDDVLYFKSDMPGDSKNQKNSRFPFISYISYVLCLRDFSYKIYHAYDPDTLYSGAFSIEKNSFNVFAGPSVLKLTNDENIYPTRFMSQVSARMSQEFRILFAAKLKISKWPADIQMMF